MRVEWEATFPNVDPHEVRERLRRAGAELVKKEFLMKRVVFRFPEGHEVKGGWVRVRDEGDRVTMSVKSVTGNRIRDQKEVLLVVHDFDDAVVFLESVGFRRQAYQESKREWWKLGRVEVTIDTWPFLEPFVEVEGKSEVAVKAACQRLGFEYGEALFCSVDTLYSRKYGVSEEKVCDETPKITFGGENPFAKP